MHLVTRRGRMNALRPRQPFSVRVLLLVYCCKPGKYGLDYVVYLSNDVLFSGMFARSSRPAVAIATTGTRRVRGVHPHVFTVATPPCSPSTSSVELVPIGGRASPPPNMITRRILTLD